MIERKFVKEKMNDFKIQKYLESVFRNCSYSHTIIQKTPLGEKLIIYSAKPGLIVGRGGSNIKTLVATLKKDFGMQSPQIEVQEVPSPDLDPYIVAEKVADELAKTGKSRFKFVGHSATQRVMNAGARGVEVKISGQIPSKRAKAWRFIEGYLPKTGYPSDHIVVKGYRTGQQKLGTIGVTVKILPPDAVLPDAIHIIKAEKKPEAAAVKAIEPEPVKKEEKPKEKAPEKKEETSIVPENLEKEIEADILKQLKLSKEEKK